MSEQSAMLRAVLGNPACDTVRLAYADWLEERGEPAGAERGGFVRFQFAWEHHAEMDDTGDRFQEYPLSCGVWPYEEWPDSAYRLFGFDRGAAPALAAYRWRRGFIDRIELPTATFLAHAAAIFAAHPVTRVVLTDREPNTTTVQGEASWYFHDGSSLEYSHWLPVRLTGAMRSVAPDAEWHAHWDDRKRWSVVVFPSAEDSHAALSDACVACGRAEAGLPALTPAELTGAGA